MTTPAPRRCPARRVTVFRSPTAAPRACSATEASTASFSTRTIGTQDDSSPRRSGFIRPQKPSRCLGERPAASTGAGTPTHTESTSARPRPASAREASIASKDDRRCSCRANSTK